MTRGTAKLISVLALAALLGGCGFHPMYAQRTPTSPKQTVADRLALIKIGTIQDRQGQILRNALVERLTPKGEPSKPAYTLRVTLSKTEGGINFQKNATASSGETSVSATWVLTDLATGKSPAGATFTSVDSFNYLGPRYGSIAEERDSEERVYLDMADMIVDRIAATLAALPPPKRQL